MIGIPKVLTTSANLTKRLKVSINEQLVDGPKALTVQPFTEQNIKSGKQFETAAYTPDAVSEDILIQTGSQYVIIKAIDLQIDGDGIQYQILSNVTATPGTAFEVTNLKAGDTNAAETAVSLVDDANTDNAVTESPLITLIGSTTPGSASTPTQTIPGLERILQPNTDYLLRRESLTDEQSQKSAFYMTWHEGELSTNIDLEK